jgi:hypothetical protein
MRNRRRGAGKLFRERVVIGDLAEDLRGRAPRRRISRAYRKLVGAGSHARASKCTAATRRRMVARVIARSLTCVSLPPRVPHVRVAGVATGRESSRYPATRTTSTADLTFPHGFAGAIRLRSVERAWRSEFTVPFRGRYRNRSGSAAAPELRLHLFQQGTRKIATWVRFSLVRRGTRALVRVPRWTVPLIRPECSGAPARPRLRPSCP